MSHTFSDTLRTLGLRTPPRADGDPEFLKVLGLALGGFSTQFPLDNYTDQMRVYRVSALVYRCAQLWAESILQAPVKILRVRDGRVQDEVTSGPVTNVLREINGHVSFQEWMYVNVLHLALTGNAYTWKVRNRAGRIVELWPLRPDEIWIRYDPFFDPIGKLRYEWRPFSGGIGGHGGMYTFKRHNLLHLRLPSPVSQVFGTAPLRASADDVLADQQAKKSTLSWLENEGIPAGVLQTEQVLTPDQADLIKQRWRDAHTGPERRGKVAVLGAGTKFTPIAVTPKDIEWLNQRKLSRAGVLMSFGVPPIYAGMEGENFANRKEQRLLFWQDTIRPKLRLLEGQLTEFLLRDWSPDLVWRFDESRIDAFIEAFAGRVAAATRAADPGRRVLRPFEARERILGIEERFEGDDEFLVPGNMVPADDILEGTAVPQGITPQDMEEALNEEEVIDEADLKRRTKLDKVKRKQVAVETKMAKDLGKYFRFLSGQIEDRLTSGKKPGDLVSDADIDRALPAVDDVADQLLDASQAGIIGAFREGYVEGEEDVKDALEE